MSNTQIQINLLKMIRERIIFHIRLMAKVAPYPEYPSPKFQTLMQGLDEQSLSTISRQTTNFAIRQCVDPILYPREIYDNADNFPKVDIAQALNLIYGINCSIEQAVGYLLHEITSGRDLRVEQSQMLLEIRARLVDEGLFPDEDVTWFRNYTAIYTENKEESYKKRILTIERIFNPSTVEKIVRSLATSIVETYYDDGNKDASQAKYSQVAKRILHDEFEGFSEYQNLNIKRQLFKIFPNILKHFDQLSREGEIIVDGQMYYNDLCDASGPEQLLEKIINQAIKDLNLEIPVTSSHRKFKF